MSALPKPVLRGHIKRSGLRAILGGLMFSVLNGSLYYFLVKVPYQKKYEEFMNNYDQDAHLENLLKWGYFQTIKEDF